MRRYQKSQDRGLDSIYGTLTLLSTGKVASLEIKPPVQGLEVKPFLEFLNQETPVARTSMLKTAGLPTEVEILRSWIDEWIESGRGDDGDDPRRRNYQKARKVAIAVYEYSARGKIHFIGHGNSLHLWIEEYKTLPVSGFRTLLSPPNENYASEQLVFFLASELRLSLTKCRSENCGAYFLLKHWNRLYKHGTFCDMCQRKRSQESAKRATAQEREDIRAALYDVIAKRFSKQIIADSLWYSSDGMKKKIAQFVSIKFAEDERFSSAYPNGITGKWVANVKNWKPIGVAAKGANNVTRKAR